MSAHVLLFVSGAASLVYALVWSSHLQQILGSSGQAQAIVIATFLGGLAGGAFVLGRLADRVKRPLLLWGLLELAIGAWAALYPFVHRAGEALFSTTGSKLIIAALSLLIPALLMGGRLPLMLVHLTRTAAGMRGGLATLCAVSSLGASIGLLLAGGWLVPAIGLRESSGLAVSLSLVVAIAAVLLGRKATLSPASAAEVFPGAQARAAFFGVVLLGFTSMLLGQAWIRLLAIVLGGSTSAFTSSLAALLLGIAFGSAWASRRAGSLRLFGLLQLGLVAGVCLTLPLYVRLPHLFWATHDLLARTQDTWPLYQAITFGFACMVLLIPGFFIGAAFPAGARVAMSGRVFAVSTLGAIAGVVAGGLVLLPLITMEKSFVLAIGLTLASASVAIWLSSTGARRLVPIGLGAAGVIAFVAATSGWSHVVANMSASREYGRPFESFSAYAKATEAEFAVDFHADDSLATVTVSHDPKRPKNQYLRINGRIDASTDPDDVETQILSGHLGMLLAPKLPKKVLVIGAGAGLTAGSVLTHDVERLDLVEISPAVLEGARRFAEANDRALDDPRVHLHVDDPKAFLALAGHKYDLIISVQSNPWTRELFRTIDAHLEDDGVLLQSVHFQESSEPLVRLVMRTLRETFPYSTTWGGSADLLVVSTRKQLNLDFDELGRRMALPKVKASLQRIHLDRVVALLAKQVHTSPAQQAWAGQGPINSADHNLFESGGAKAFFLRARRIEIGDQRKQPGRHGLWIEAWLEKHPLTADDARAIYANLSFFHPKDDPIVRAAAEKWLELAPDDRAARHAAAKLALSHGDVAAALSRLGKSTEPADLPMFLEATGRSIATRRTVWADVELPVVGPPATPEAKEQLEKLCKLAPVEGCP